MGHRATHVLRIGCWANRGGTPSPADGCRGPCPSSPCACDYRGVVSIPRGCRPGTSMCVFVCVFVCVLGVCMRVHVGVGVGCWRRCTEGPTLLMLWVVLPCRTLCPCVNVSACASCSARWLSLPSPGIPSLPPPSLPYCVLCTLPLHQGLLDFLDAVPRDRRLPMIRVFKADWPPGLAANPGLCVAMSLP